MTPGQLRDLKAAIVADEGCIPWLYRDNGVAGSVTCGVGHLVPGFSQALALPFRPLITGSEWAALTTAPRGMRAQSYQIDTLGRLSPADIDAILESDLKETEAQLRTAFSKWNDFPAGPQAALINMGFNLGVARLLASFPYLCAMVRSQDWAGCAKQCHRAGISETRNAETAALFTVPRGPT